jgi:hypothetical protein
VEKPAHANRDRGAIAQGARERDHQENEIDPGSEDRRAAQSLQEGESAFAQGQGSELDAEVVGKDPIVKWEDGLVPQREQRAGHAETVGEVGPDVRGNKSQPVSEERADLAPLGCLHRWGKGDGVRFVR